MSVMSPMWPPFLSPPPPPALEFAPCTTPPAESATCFSSGAHPWPSPLAAPPLSCPTLSASAPFHWICAGGVDLEQLQGDGGPPSDGVAGICTYGPEQDTEPPPPHAQGARKSSPQFASGGVQNPKESYSRSTPVWGAGVPAMKPSRENRIHASLKINHFLETALGPMYWPGS